MDSLIRLAPSSSGVPHPLRSDMHPLRSVMAFYRDLLHCGGDFYILDWGWPKGQWRPSSGLVYRVGMLSQRAEVVWNREQLTYRPRKYKDTINGHGKPWPRLILCQGIYRLLSKENTFQPRSPSLDGEASILEEFPLLMSHDNGTILKHLALHTHCLSQTSHMVSTNPCGISYGRGILNEGFHIVYFEILSSYSQAIGSWDIESFYNPDLPKFQKSAFTLLSVPGETTKLDTDYWTFLCFTAEGFAFQDEKL
ncbi:uncharacterized protein K444DRAFT_385938 [Hyaloscypha bicolor E]|uniref:Uncharacterized protein n=1 Tax=Hyaloscypha bicolor E TaxID=1095630 RepID=A0A2J6TDG1_9HELO|nr:uncharacterized protein K444DRAFT_385938 [Hyaloscypha bicolor E]PMD61061.1 hypothetical protein K444DRAFT_385938 [Hyaloscypha bicolor E]